MEGKRGSECLLKSVSNIDFNPILSGYFFGNTPVVKAHFELIMLGIVFVSLIPVAIMALINKRKGQKADA
ncbi:hypothetical protein [Pediococcus pentosaceus]|uniref:hypothetical protein n=1 Tax=Pediococcus pentosaceus TaxID=1255 RepID=UPI003593D152